MNLNAKTLTMYDKNPSKHTLMSEIQSSEHTYTFDMFREGKGGRSIENWHCDSDGRPVKRNYL